MTLPVLERDATLSSLADSSHRLSEAIRSVRDPGKTAIGHWTIRDVAIHTSHVFTILSELIDGGRSPVKDHLKMSEVWDAMVLEDDETDLNAIADRIDHRAKEWIDKATPEMWTREIWWHGELRMPVWALSGILVNEAEVHALDIATAEDRPWEISRQKAIESTVALVPALPSFVNEEVAKGLNAAIELRLRGGPRIYVTITDGALTTDVAPRSVDVHISADPVEYLLIGFGRKSQWPAIATGKVVAWGRKPWLALKFSNLFHSP